MHLLVSSFTTYRNMQSTHRPEMTIPGKIIASYGGRCVKQITGNIGREGTINLLRAGDI